MAWDTYHLSDTWNDKCHVSSLHKEKSESEENSVEEKKEKKERKKREKGRRERDRERGKIRRSAASSSNLQRSDGRNSLDISLKIQEVGFFLI